MSNLLTTIGLAVIVVLIAIGVISIGWILTGKSRVRLGMCGRDPTVKRTDEEGCGTGISCDLCKKTDKKKENDVQKRGS
jgi:hypothetical protein